MMSLHMFLVFVRFIPAVNLETFRGSICSWTSPGSQLQVLSRRGISGMSEATKRKHVFTELLQGEFTRIQANQQIVRVKESKGNNLHEVELPDSKTFLVSMPSKFRKNVWIKKGDYIVIEPIEEGDKVKAEMVKPISKGYIKFLKSEKQWPEEFDEVKEKPVGEDMEFVNTNRRIYEESTSEESD